MSKDTILRQAVRGALAVGAAGSLMGAGVALAQTAAPASGTAGATQLSNITVTGSHIPRTSIATAQPITTITRQQIDATGFTTLGELLTNLPQAGPSINLDTTNNVGRSAGAVYLNIHNLGSQRLLVLINGLRVPTGPTGAVDFNIIPLAAVDRIQVLLDGASPVYGTGAIAGVVNVITTKNFNGASASAYLGEYDARSDGGGWDGKTQKYSFSIGTAGDRSAVLLNMGYQNFDPILMSNRTLSKYPDYPGFNGTLFGSSNVPQGRFSFLAPAGDPHLPGYAASQCSTTTTFTSCSLSGPLTGPNYNPHAYSGPNDSYNFSPVNYLRDGQEKYHVYTQGHYDLTDNVSFHSNLLYERTNTLLVGAAAPLGIGATGPLPSRDNLGIGIAGNNPYNPFGVDLVPFTPSQATAGNPKYVEWCRLYGSGANGGCTADHYYLYAATNRDISYGQRLFQYQISTFRYSGGFTGYFMVGGNQWTWNADYVYGNVQTVRNAKNLYNDARLAQALGNVGNCPAATCVPYDFFGGAYHSPAKRAMANYVQYTAVSSVDTELRQYVVSLAGNFFNSWYAGPWGFAVGYDYHVNDSQFTPDSLIQEGISSTNGTLPSNGRVGDNAQYAELNIPFGAGVPGFEKFDVDLATRWAQFKTQGSGAVGGGGGPAQPATGRNHYTVNVSHVGIKWYPVNSLLIRASWTQGFRVPSVSEFFAGGQQSYSGVIDPCVSGKAQASGATNCPANPTQPNKQILTTFGGNAALNPERSISRSIGFVYSPTWAPGLDFSVDYYKVDITQAIGSIGPGTIVNDCYSPAEVYCNQITRVGGIITGINAITENLGSFDTNGWDVNLGYKFPTTPIGQFDASINANFVKFLTTCNPASVAPPDGACYNSAGDGSGASGIPKHKFQFELDWSYGPWSATYLANLIGPMYQECMINGIFGVPDASAPSVQYLYTTPINGYARALPRCTKPNASVGQHKDPNGNIVPNSVGQVELGTTIYQDIQASYTLAAWNTTFTLGVNNIFDRSPPIQQVFVQAPSYLTNTYRVPGRFIYGRISVNF
ncbi:MAG: TonB-dependent receptor domain-containing protein [Gammaproteobacteria bacterium]